MVHDGWGRLAFGSTITSSRSLVEYAYESTALTGIAAGGVPAVPESASYALMGLDVVGLLLARSRKTA